MAVKIFSNRSAPSKTLEHAKGAAPESVSRGQWCRRPEFTPIILASEERSDPSSCWLFDQERFADSANVRIFR